MAGVSRLQYQTEIRLIRVMCSGRVDLEFMLRAFANGEDGVFIGACRLNECNYTTHGNYDAFGNTYLCKKILKEFVGLNPERLTIEFMSGGDGPLLAELIDKFTGRIKGIGPLGKAEGLDKAVLQQRLEAVRNLVPYIKLVERERMRFPLKSKKAYDEFYAGEEFDKLFNELIADKLVLSLIMALVREKPVSAGDISGLLGLKPSEVSRHIVASAKQGLIRFDENENLVAVS